MPPKKKVKLNWNKFNLDGWWSPVFIGKCQKFKIQKGCESTSLFDQATSLLFS